MVGAGGSASPIHRSSLSLSEKLKRALEHSIVRASPGIPNGTSGGVNGALNLIAAAQEVHGVECVPNAGSVRGPDCAPNSAPDLQCYNEWYCTAGSGGYCGSG